MTDEEIAKECEKRFQNGGPKVYYYDPIKTNIIASSNNIKDSVSLAYPGEQVFARRKKNGVYSFVRVNK